MTDAHFRVRDLSAVAPYFAVYHKLENVASKAYSDVETRKKTEQNAVKIGPRTYVYW